MSGEITRTALFFFLTGTLLLWTSLRRFRAMRVIQDTARSRAASAPQGHVELQGVAWPDGDGAFHTPSGSEVVHHSMKIEKEETRGTGKNRRKTWVTVFRKEHAPPFFLVDATGLVRVDPRDADLDLQSRRTRQWNSVPEDEKRRILECTAGHSIPGFPPSEFMFGLFGSPYRVTESWIAVGSPLYAHGDFRTAPGNREDVHSTGLTRFHELVFDRTRREPRAVGEILGRREGETIRAQEVIEGFGTAAAFARTTARTSGDIENGFPVTGQLATSAQHRLFVADRDEEHLVQGMGRIVYLPFGGAIAALAAAMVLFFGAPSPTTTAAAGATRVAAPAPGDHATLRARCFDGAVDACLDLLRRADELRVSADFRQDYARRACALGRLEVCPKADRR